MRSKLENLLINWVDDTYLYPNFNYMGDLIDKPGENLCDYERLEYHLQKYCDLSKRGRVSHDIYADRNETIPILLTFPKGTLKNLSTCAIPEEDKTMKELNDRISKMAELTDDEFRMLLLDISRFATNRGNIKEEQVPENLRGIPDSLLIRAEKLGWWG